MTERVRAAGIVIHNNTILLMERRKYDKNFFVIPGGGVKDDESIKEAVSREIKEETTLIVKPKRLLYQLHQISHSKNYIYLCSYISGIPQLGDFNEKEEMEKGGNWYKPQWVSLKKLPSLLLYPKQIHEWLLQDIKNGFSEAPRKASLFLEKV